MWLFGNGGFGYAQPPFWWIIVIGIRDENQLIRWLSEVETTGEDIAETAGELRSTTMD